MNKGKTSVKNEQGDSSEPTKEIMTFGSTVLPFQDRRFQRITIREALNEEIRKQQKYGTVFVKVQSQIPYYRKGKYRQNFHHFLVTPLIEQTEEGLTEPQCDKFLRDARLYESLGNKYAEDYNSLSFDTVVKNPCYQLPPPKWDDEIPILMNEDTGSSSISNFHRIPEHHASNTPRPNFGGSQHTQIPSADKEQGRQRGRNFPYEYINNLPRANVNDGSMLILSGTPPQLWEEVIGRWESSTILHCSNISFANNQEKIKIGFTFPALPEPVRSTTDYPTLVRELINRNRDLEDQLEQLQKQLQQLKDSRKRSCISPNAIPKHFYEEMYGQKFEMNKGKTSVKNEQGDSSEPTKEIMTFGSTVLVKYPPGHSKAFKPLPHLPTPDESQQCLLDALWNASTAKQKHTALNALNFYFSKILEKPLSKNFSFYVLFRGERPGIYINYPELVKAIGNSSRPFWQGFYSFQEAWNQATASLPPPIFVEGKSIAELPPQIGYRYPCLNPNKRRVVQEHLSNLVPFFEIQPLIESRHLQRLINLQLQLLDLHHRTPSDGRYRIDQDVTSWFNTDGEYIYNGLLKLVINLDRPTQVLNGEECPIDYMEFLSYGMVAAFSVSEDFKELPFGEALNEEIRKQQKYGTVFVKVQSQIPYYRKGKYRQNFHHFLVTPLIEQTEEGLTEPQCDKFLRDARLYMNHWATSMQRITILYPLTQLLKNLVTRYGSPKTASASVWFKRE
ncbi:hypothetical protein K1719_033334 [Acacia pycnantha]|nr:hypothetical protein K1719_033334 [Acacia pycnantha]